VHTGYFEELARDLRGGNLDILIGMSTARPHDARHVWALKMAWVRGLTTELDPNRPVPLVSYGEPCLYHRFVVQALQSAGLDWELVFAGPSMMSLSSAVVAGLGVMGMVRGRANDHGLVVWDDSPLPELPDLYGGVYIREGRGRAAYEQLADEIAEALDMQCKGARRLSPNVGRLHTSAA
jgi:DNA-binding transcriptional LysR family regulator